MVSKIRMQIDLLAQSILIALVSIAWLSMTMWLVYTLLVVLWVWQLASAIHLHYGYPYQLRKLFLQMILVQLPFLLLALTHLPSLVVWLLLASTLFYFGQTIRDWRIVARRPVSFWQLI